MPRFLLTEEPDDSGAARILGDDARHIAGPLRRRVGDRVELCLPGRWLTGEVTAIARDTVAVRVTEDTAAPPEPPGPILCSAMPARAAWERILELATEFGASEVWPLRTARSAPAREGRETDRALRWQRVCEEARKLSGRTRCPALLPALPLSEALERLPGPLAMLDAGGEPADEAPSEWLASAALLVGPEGGFTEAERAEALARGGRVLTLGAYTLRAETAVAAGLALLTCARGQFRV